MSKALYILGAGGHGKVVGDIAELNGWSQISFLDDKWPEMQSCSIWPVVGKIENYKSILVRGSFAVVAIGDSATRLTVQRDLLAYGVSITPMVHPKAIVSPRAKIGVGSVICAGAVISSDSSIGDGCICNTGALVDHDCVVGDGVHLSPGSKLAGDVKIGINSWIGMGADVIQGVRIGSGVRIGASSLVLKDVPDGKTYAGVPAKLICKRE